MNLAPSRLTLVLLLTASAALAAQQTPPPPAAPQPAAQSTIEVDPPTEILIDQDCRIVTVDLRNPAHPKPHHRADLSICRQESRHDSEHWEKVEKNGALKDTLVRVREYEFVLQNPYPRTVTFIVSQPVDKGYRIDSDPQPSEILNSTSSTSDIAVFRVVVEPHQSVRLHVGERD